MRLINQIIVCIACILFGCLGLAAIIGSILTYCNVANIVRDPGYALFTGIGWLIFSIFIPLNRHDSDL